MTPSEMEQHKQTANNRGINMYYITVKQSPQYHQMTLEELFSESFLESTLVTPNISNTRTYECETVSPLFLKRVDVGHLINVLIKFNESTEELRKRERKSLYREFYIPKKSGGLRRIDAPNDELMDALRELKRIFENDFGALYHTAAFAYVKNRSTLECIKRHKQNESKWFAKYDLSDFFGSTTKEFTVKMFSMIFPFSEVMRSERGKREFEKAIDLAFLHGGLPQGTPVSPTITNICMIPIDYRLSNLLKDYKHQRYVYTRYADDFQVSSKYDFNFREIENLIIETLREFGADFKLNSKKTRYGSSSGSNWNLGIMLNKEGEITVGYKNKKRFQAMLSSYIMDRKNGIAWSKHDVQILEGYRNYYKMVEGETIDRIVSHISNKFGVNVIEMIKADLKTANN